MLNVLAVYLVLSSILTASVIVKEDDVVIVKQGHRVVVVEYEKEREINTKVSISPPRDEKTRVSDDKTHDVVSAAKEKSSTAATATKEAAEEAKDKVKEASSVLSDAFSPTDGGRHSPRELVCDALGKCKHKIASVLGKAKEKVSEVEEHAKEAVGEAIGKAKETVSHKTERVEEIAKEVAGKAKETLSQKTERAEEIAKEAADKAKTIGKHVMKNGSEKAKETAEQGGEMAGKAAEAAKASGGDIFRRTWKAAEMDFVVGVVHLVGCSIAYGVGMWVTFVLGYVLAGVLPRQQFGVVQSRIYPVYFRTMGICVGLALVGFLLSEKKGEVGNVGEMFQGFCLMASLLMILINAFFLEPRATKVMFERMKMEREEGRGRVDPITDPSATPARGADTTSTPPATPRKSNQKSRIVKLSERLKKLNAYSSVLNILTLMALSCHLVYLSQRLHLSC